MPLGPERRAALRLLGDHWMLWLLIAIHERDGARFTDLAAEPGLSRRVLSERLTALVEAGLVETERYSTRPPRNRYRLTDRGAAIRRHALAIAHIGAGGSIAAMPVAITGAPGPSATANAPHLRPSAGDIDAAAPDGGSDEEHPVARLLDADHAAARTIIAETVEPLMRYDDQYRTQLVETLETWVLSDASASVTAARMYAHRHTIRYRLSRVRELTGLDVDVLADRERLVLGLRALRMFERQGIDPLD